MSRHSCHSFQRQTWPGSTTLPSFTGSHQRTSKSRLQLYTVVYIAIFVAWMLIWSRRGTHTAEKHRHSPCSLFTVFTYSAKLNIIITLPGSSLLTPGYARIRRARQKPTDPLLVPYNHLQSLGALPGCGAHAPTRQEFLVYYHIYMLPTC